jgi:hypothetical protein
MKLKKEQSSGTRQTLTIPTMLDVKRRVKILPVFSFIFAINVIRMILSCVSTKHYKAQTYVMSHCLEDTFRNVHIFICFNFLHS